MLPNIPLCLVHDAQDQPTDEGSGDKPGRQRVCSTDRNKAGKDPLVGPSALVSSSVIDITLEFKLSLFILSILRTASFTLGAQLFALWYERSLPRQVDVHPGALAGFAADCNRPAQILLNDAANDMQAES